MLTRENNSLEIICENISENPKCPHGPTLLFKKDQKEYFACSAYRNLNGCSFYKKKFDKHFNPIPKSLYNLKEVIRLRRQIVSLKPELRCYCHTCNIPFDSKNLHNHHAHETLIGISDKLYMTPTQFLRPLSNDKAEAQYFFKDTSLQFFEHNFKKLRTNKIVCIGVPRLHEHLKCNYERLKIRSILLDLDHRLFYFNDENDFIHYNMFNNYFFEGQDKQEVFESYLRLENNDCLLIITDPPFGCRSEPLVETLNQLIKTFHNVNNIQCFVPIMWIFPYYMEHYIRKFMVDMKMIDYKINYTNHELYNDSSGGRKYGSPVRVFTNIPASMIDIPKNLQKSEAYKYCDICCRFTGKENIHCDICDICPSKNGETYRHCSLCAECVKPNYQHCFTCQRCTQKMNHNCDEYRTIVRCWICRKIGHSEAKCPDWTNKSKKKLNIIRKNQRICLLCSRIGKHNEKRCPQRVKLKYKTWEL